MALVKETFTLGINDCKLYPITSDTDSEFVCGTGVDVPGIQEVTMEIEIDEKELYGDEQVLDIYSKAKKVNFTATCAKVSLDVIAATLGGTVTAGGSTPNQTQTLSYDLGTISNYFQLAGKVDYVEELQAVGDYQFNITKCKINSNSFGQPAEEYGTFSFAGNGINSTYGFTAPKGKALTLKLAETASALAAVTSS